MYKITSKLWMGRVCAISFILFCSMLKIQNAFAQRHWDMNKDMTVAYNLKEKYIIFEFLFFDYTKVLFDVQSFMSKCEIKYSEDDKKYTPLLTARTDLNVTKEVKNLVWMNIVRIKEGQKIEFPNTFILSKRSLVGVNMTVTNRVEDYCTIKNKTARMIFKWHVPESCKPIKLIKFEGSWGFSDKGSYQTINVTYVPNIVDSNLKTMINTPSVMKAEINDNVMVNKDADAIIVTGAQPGENISVYTVSGVELKSVVANDDVVNIKLPKNQIYIVKAGFASYKITL